MPVYARPAGAQHKRSRRETTATDPKIAFQVFRRMEQNHRLVIERIGEECAAFVLEHERHRNLVGGEFVERYRPWITRWHSRNCLERQDFGFPPVTVGSCAIVFVFVVCFFFAFFRLSWRLFDCFRLALGRGVTSAPFSASKRQRRSRLLQQQEQQQQQQQRLLAGSSLQQQQQQQQQQQRQQRAKSGGKLGGNIL